MHVQPGQVPLFRRGYRLQWEATQNGYVILYPEGMAKLNESASAILTLVDGNKSVAEMVTELQARFPQAEGLEEDVLEFLALAYAQKWVVFRD
ncbi:pyrroloquinoline quinone biosynthesis peptide chaperone PqqD [Vagococcus sp. WN89Y]|uniref:pyrroloquinoline quinone biosynthesis peptide chaperone PqqD n=1 Tax=Vagococcus sp. WN89Y TaxID=3457258 RepID=UPI003FCD8F82